jgi:hypothetical protein
MVNKNKKGMNTEDPLHLGNKEVSIILKETTKEKIVIIQGTNSKGLHHKEDYSLPGVKVYFMVIVLLVLNLDIKL